MRDAILLYCQHVLGMGHLVRSMALARALADRFRVVFLNGGRVPRGLPRPAGVEFVDLPPLGFDAMERLVSHDSRRPLEHAQRERRETILRTFHRVQPRAVVVELFPFGRRQFAEELLPLFEEARAGGPLFRAAVEAHAILWRRERLRTTVVAGPFLPEADWRPLRRAAREVAGLELRRSVPNLGERLLDAAASVSQCGYNTALDIVC